MDTHTLVYATTIRIRPPPSSSTQPLLHHRASPPSPSTQTNSTHTYTHICTRIYTHIQRYAAVRRVRGDGNCFYRSFLFAYMDHLLREKVILW